ncbi:BURP domain-containing protein 6 [Physcomitrium patens]|uniref:BURP domain-containing protein n=1 Tax=Physcomitrium patens TaxID=3218 RepID=A0A2K1L064_PHYPA|nr:BURP domain protein RD22-like [Physcomitrium patens]PNR59419.1 hypothetical protein PHYPA_002210 [Physcomitrium patens]|eukprot:XP_024358284.1 BURP domain protein RD22-like [Physcomitrella patens]
MVSRPVFAVLLAIVALGGIVAADAAGRPLGAHGGDGNSDFEVSIQRLEISSSLMSSIASPLNAERTKMYLDQMNDNTLGQYSKDFCQEARLQCSAEVDMVDPTLKISSSELLNQEVFDWTQQLVETTRSMQFNRDDINKGNEIALPADLHDSFPTVAFLPHSMAQKMPLSSARMTQVLDTLNIRHDSNMAKMMSQTVDQCEMQEQSKGAHKCVTSLEDMKNFVSSSLPLDKRITTLQRSSSIRGTGEMRSKNMRWKVMDVKRYDSAVVCRNRVFPYAVFECHDISNTDMHIYSVEMQGNDGARSSAVVACHENAEHMSKHTEPVKACHWVTDSLIWVPAN